MTTEHPEWLDVATCYFCDGEYTADEWEDHHTPAENPLSHCHARCCDHPGCQEEEERRRPVRQLRRMHRTPYHLGVSMGSGDQ